MIPAGTADLITANAVPSPEVVDQVAAEFRRLQEKATLELAIALGRLIVDRLYGGDTANIHGRDPRRDGLGGLAAHPTSSAPRGRCTATSWSTSSRDASGG